MSSYNENLRSNVLVSLQAQELELKKVKAKKNASLFTLYYAEGATLKASEQLESTTALWKNKMAVKTQAVDNSNISNNLLDSANQANLYVKQSITNSSVCAANVQLAANSIVRLASDLGSIYGIVHAADAKSDMYQLADESRTLINKTAYDAELASQLAMEASMRTSEVTAATVQDKAKANNDLMNNVLKIISDEFTAVSQQGLTEDATLASTSSIEKQAEGDYLDITVDYKAAKAAYKASNKGLNLNLDVSGKSSTGFTVSFDAITMPFQHLQQAANIVANPYYPVKNYYFIVVKDSKKSTFSISNAENLLINDLAGAAVSTNTSASSNDEKPIISNQKRNIIPLQLAVGVTATEEADSSSDDSIPAPKTTVRQVVNFQEMMIDGKGPYTIQDSDSDDIQLGVRYVVFVFALYTDDYKKKLNCFDDFLSAPSPSFKLTNQLAAVDGTTIKGSLSSHSQGSPHKYLLNFSVKENPDYAKIVEYRCIFLPPNDPYAGFLLNTEFTLAFNQEVELLEEIAEQYDPGIAFYEAKVISLQNYISTLISKQASLDKEKQSVDANSASILQTSINTVVEQLAIQQTSLTDAQKNLNDLIAERNQKMDQVKNAVQSGKIEFLFNLKLAEQVLAGNYIVATPSTTTETPTQKKTKNNSGDSTTSSDSTDTTGGFPEVSWEVKVGPDATDNFGNPLMHGAEYVPVIVSYCTALEENLPMFTNNWSGYASSPKFLYKKSHS